MDSRLTITAKKSDDYVNKVDLSGNTFIIQTEDLGAKSCKIITKTYQNGAIVDTTTTSYAHLAEDADLKIKVKELMDTQHKTSLDIFSKKSQKPPKSKGMLAGEMKMYLGKKKRSAALEVVKEALLHFPEDPFFLSHWGYLKAVVEKKKKEGCIICENAIKEMAKTTSEDKDFFYPILYLNMGMTYLTCNEKKAALDAFREGLKYDSKHRELQSHIVRLGFRRAPVISFLDRGNPLNKYLGIIRHKILAS